MLLALDAVEKTYAAPDGSNRPVLRNISLTLAEGETVAITGPSGSGKSTLLHLMGALDRPTRGTVRLAGADLGQASVQEMARHRRQDLGFVFQQHFLLPHCTVLENVLLPAAAGGRPAKPDAVVRRARHLLEVAGLSGRLHDRPGTLSGGECQRVAVVRALINQPRLLLADEPTGSLDRATAEEVAGLLIRLNQEERVALVLVTHSHSLARRMQRIYRLLDGELRLQNGAGPAEYQETAP